jgi:hypothetical protein
MMSGQNPYFDQGFYAHGDQERNAQQAAQLAASVLGQEYVVQRLNEVHEQQAQQEIARRLLAEAAYVRDLHVRELHARQFFGQTPTPAVQPQPTPAVQSQPTQQDRAESEQEKSAAEHYHLNQLNATKLKHQQECERSRSRRRKVIFRKVWFAGLLIVSPLIVFTLSVPDGLLYATAVIVVFWKTR